MFIKPGSILLCISDLPVGISIKDLKTFVLGGIDALRGRSLRMSPAISNCIILRLTHPHTGAVSHQGLVAVQPARLALDLIEPLRRIPLRGASVRVCRYRHSSFEVGLAGETKSIGDLLGISDADNVAEAPACRLDLVVHTGDPIGQPADPSISAPIVRPSIQRVSNTEAPQTNPHEAGQRPDTGGAFAH